LSTILKYKEEKKRRRNNQRSVEKGIKKAGIKRGTQMLFTQLII